MASHAHKKDQYTIVLEKLRDDFRAFGEKLEGVDTIVEEIKVLKAQLTNLENKIVALETQMGEVKTTVGRIDKRDHEDIKALYGEVAVLKKRIKKLETRAA